MFGGSPEELIGLSLDAEDKGSISPEKYDYKNLLNNKGNPLELDVSEGLSSIVYSAIGLFGNICDFIEEQRDRVRFLLNSKKKKNLGEDDTDYSNIKTKFSDD